MFQFREKKKIISVFFSLVLISSFLIALRLEKKVAGIRNIVFYIFSATPKYLDNVLESSNGVYDRVEDLILTYKKNEQLRNDIQGFIKKEAYFIKIKLENERLKEILSYESNLSYKSQIVARMIGREPNNWYNAILINKGLKDGVNKNDVVVAYQQGQEGVVGKIIETSNSVSKVLLVTDSNSAIAGYIRRNKEEGLIGGQNEEKLAMKYLSSKADVQLDDLVVTSGYGGVFPAEINVGVVKNIIEDKNQQHFKKALIYPIINFSQISDVLIIKR